MLVVDGISEIYEKYDALLVDQWGVLHDGRLRYEGVQEALELLSTRGKIVIVGTNSSKSAARNVARLAGAFGISSTLYHGLISSAEMLRRHILSEEKKYKKLMLIADLGDEVLFNGDSIQLVNEPKDADCLVLLSVNPEIPIDGLMNILQASVERGLKLLTPSRDVSTVTVRGVFSGLERICSAYEDLGGGVMNFGKPELSFYEDFRPFIRGLPASKILVVGDQLRSDILGGIRCGFDTLLVGTGAGVKEILDLGGGGEGDSDFSPTYFCRSFRP